MKGETFAAFGKAFQLLMGSTAGSVAVGIPVEGEVVGIILHRWPYPCRRDKTELALFQPSDTSVVISLWTHINGQMEELLWSAGNVELVPTLLSTPLKPEAHGLQAGLPAGFSKWRELCDQSGETVDYLSCVWLQPLLMESFKFKEKRLIHKKQPCWSGRSLAVVKCFSEPEMIYFPLASLILKKSLNKAICHHDPRLFFCPVQPDVWPFIRSESEYLMFLLCCWSDGKQERPETL